MIVYFCKSDESFISKSYFNRNCRWCIIETQPACDYAQSKTGLFRYVLALEVPSEMKEGKPKLKPGLYLEQTPEFLINNESKKLVLNFRFIFGLTAAKVGTLKPVYRIREQLLQDISFKLANYSARPGIIEFR
jgi:hypothetical protein